MEDACVTIDTTVQVHLEDPALKRSPKCQIEETIPSLTEELLCHPPEDLTDLDPELPTPSHREVLPDHQEGNRVHPHPPADHQIRDQDPSQPCVADHLSLTVPGATAGQEMTAGADMAVRIQPTAVVPLKAQLLQ